MTWPKELPLTDALQVRKMERKAATQWLKQKYPAIAQEVLDAAVEVAKPDTEGEQVRVLPLKHPAEGHFIAAAWLLGASLSQLALLTGTSRSNCYAIVNRRLNADQRRLLRRKYALTFESLQSLQKLFLSNLRTSPDVFANMTANDIASFLEDSITVEQ